MPSSDHLRQMAAQRFERMAYALHVSDPSHPAAPLLVHLGRMFTESPARVRGDWSAVAAAGFREDDDR